MVGIKDETIKVAIFLLMFFFLGKKTSPWLSFLSLSLFFFHFHVSLAKVIYLNEIIAYHNS